MKAADNDEQKLKSILDILTDEEKHNIVAANLTKGYEP